MNDSNKIILQYVLNKLLNDLPNWKSVKSRTDFQLFSNDKQVDEDIFIINFSKQVIENEINIFKTLEHIKKVNENINLPAFKVSKMIIRIDVDLAEHYKLRYVIIKNKKGNFFVYERFWPDAEEDNSNFVFNINNKKLFLPNFDFNSLFIFGLEYRYNDHCGSGSIEFFKNPFDSILFEVELQGAFEADFPPPESTPFVQENKTIYTLKIDKNTCIKINTFKNKIFLNDSSGLEMGFLIYSKMKRNISHVSRGPDVSTYYFDISGGMIFNQYYENPALGTDTQVYFPKINIIGGQIIINSKCNCSTKCNCYSFNIIFSDILLDDFSCVNIQYI